jgi:hypothetical protein
VSTGAVYLCAFIVAGSLLTLSSVPIVVHSSKKIASASLKLLLASSRVRPQVVKSNAGEYENTVKPYRVPWKSVGIDATGLKYSLVKM